MKILHVCETATGGIASYLGLLDGLSDDVSNCYVIPTDHAESLQVQGKVRTYPASGRNIRAIMANIAETRRAVRSERPDVIFFHSSFSLLSLLSLRMLGNRQPMIYCAHGWAVSMFEKASFKQRIIRAVEGRLCGLADRVINISTADLQIARSNGYSGAHVLVENAVRDIEGQPRTDLFDGGAAGDVNLLFVGRHDRQKGLDLLLQAFAEVSAARPELKLHVLGDKVRADGGALPQDGAVHFVGWVPAQDIDGWYASADALVVPSRWEGFGLVVPEAFRNGTPVLCSDRGALPGLVEEGRTGHVFALEGTALADCLAGLDIEELRAMRPSCRSAFDERFSSRDFQCKILDIYKALQAPPGAGRTVRPPS